MEIINLNHNCQIFELYKKNILILGFGRIGKALAKRCLGFEANISVYDPFVSKSDIENYGCTSVKKKKGLEMLIT